jgi:hypothetical protein
MSDTHGIMKLEWLPNEILIECFEYLNAFDIFYSFDQLNDRFNNLIRNIPLHIVFQYVNKSIFDEFCTKMLLNPKIKSQIYSLHVLDEHKSIECNTFLSYFSLDEFSNLRTFESMLAIIPSSDIRAEFDLSSYMEIKLAELLFSKLRTLSIPYLDWSFQDTREACSSIINLTISKYYSTDFYHLLKYIPLLKYLHIGTVQDSFSNPIREFFLDQPAVHLKQIVIDRYKEDFSTLEVLLKQTPNLQSLTIYGSSYYTDMLNANQWKQLITSSLPYLNIFKFEFSCMYDEYNLNIVLDKFQ